MAIAPVSFDSSSLNAILARAAGSRAQTHVQPVARSATSPTGVFRPGLDPKFSFDLKVRSDTQQRFRFSNSDGDLLDLSTAARTKLRIRFDKPQQTGQGASAQTQTVAADSAQTTSTASPAADSAAVGAGSTADASTADANSADASNPILRFDLKVKQDLRLSATNGATGAQFDAQFKSSTHLQFSIDFNSFQQLLGSNGGIDFASLLGASQVNGGANPASSDDADNDDDSGEHDDDHDNEDASKSGAPAADTGTTGAKSEKKLSKEDDAKVAKLRARDAEVRAHEAAHKGAAGGLAQGGASFEFETGPDGKRYAVGGEVSVDTSPGATPEQTIQKAEQVRRAALAPSQPSGQDRAVAAKAAQVEAKARAEQAQRQRGSGASSSSAKTNRASQPNEGSRADRAGATRDGDNDSDDNSSITSATIDASHQGANAVTDSRSAANTAGAGSAATSSLDSPIAGRISPNQRFAVAGAALDLVA